MSTLLQEIGLTQEELQERVVERATNELLGSDWPEDRDSIEHRIGELIHERIDQLFKKLADDTIQPILNEKIENLVLQQTNQWGETKGEPQSLTEYLVHRAEAYMQEPVNHSGKTKGQEGYGWKAAGPRIAIAVDSYLQHSISVAMKEIMNDANSQLVQGIKGAVDAKLAEIKGQLQVTSKVK